MKIHKTYLLQFSDLVKQKQNNNCNRLMRSLGSKYTKKHLRPKLDGGVYSNPQNSSWIKVAEWESEWMRRGKVGKSEEKKGREKTP